MTNAQLYLSIGIPALLILANAASMFLLIGRLDARIDRVDTRLDRMDARFDRMDARFDRIDARFDRVDADLRQFFAITGAHGEAIDTLKKRQI